MLVDLVHATITIENSRGTDKKQQIQDILRFICATKQIL